MPERAAAPQSRRAPTWASTSRREGPQKNLCRTASTSPKSAGMLRSPRCRDPWVVPCPPRPPAAEGFFLWDRAGSAAGFALQLVDALRGGGLVELGVEGLG